ncbi:MAG: L,D-transpeptidase [Verrucomicrobia bacterium]|nr:L,D-transpeptidase [Verrucomicrobiota bacterium]
MLRRVAAIFGVGLLSAGGSFGQGPAGGTNPATPPTRPTAAAPTPSVSSAPVAAAPAPDVRLVISVPDQKLALVVDGRVSRSYRVSTSRYGEGDALGSWRTPLGHLEVMHKIGARAPAGAVFKGRQLTGEVLTPNAPGRDPVVSRIIWLRGMEMGNRHAYQRCIYIHGTPQESFLGRKASFGCIRMRSTDIVDVFDRIGLGTDVSIVEKSMPQAVRDLRAEVKAGLIKTAVASVSSARPGASIGRPPAQVAPPPAAGTAAAAPAQVTPHPAAAGTAPPDVARVSASASADRIRARETRPPRSARRASARVARDG